MSAATKRIRLAIFKRCDEACEACGRHVTFENGRMDHFFSRGKVGESESNCWFLCLACDTARTVNEPTAAFWLWRFIAHCGKRAYLAEAELAGAKLLTLVAKGRVAA